MCVLITGVDKTMIMFYICDVFRIIWCFIVTPHV